MLREWILKLGDYILPVSILVIEFVMAIFIFMNRQKLKLSQKKQKKTGRGEQIYQEVISHSSSQIHLVMTSRERRPVFLTTNAEEFLGLDFEKLSANYMELTSIMKEKSGREFWKQYDIWDRKQSLEFEFFYDKRKTHMLMTVTSCLDDKYDLFEFRDISELKAKEKFMEEKLIAAESVSQSKTTFLSRMSHEIRTPMNGIRGMLTLIASQPHNDTIEQYLGKAEGLSDYLLSLINDILDMSRIENGKLELEEKAFSLKSVADELQVMFQKTIESNGVRYIVEMEDMTVDWVMGDRLRFTQVIINFISNASKFTKKGEIRVTFKQMMKDKNSVSIMIRVHDTGKGMDPKFVDRIFRPFEQENAGIAREYGGSGLGMAISEQIITLMGGEILVDTMPDKGTDFTVYLTFMLAAEEERTEDVSADKEESSEKSDSFTFQGTKILVAEDNEINAEIAKTILENMGAAVSIAGNGQIAVDDFANHPQGTYDFILMDIQMPVLDGRSASLKIRELDREDAKTIPIFALSADAFVEDQRLSAQAKMDGHFAKPINFKELQIEIGKYMIKHGYGGEKDQ